jgi:DNA polymerase III subunit epsilon
LGILNKISRLRSRDRIIVANNRNFVRFDFQKNLSDCSYVVFDTELTGLNRKKDEIISIGAVRIRDLQIDLSETFHYYVKPRNIDPTRATLIHRITPQQLEQAPPLEEVLPFFLKFIENDLLVGHYVVIDTSFLNRATRHLYNGTVANPRLDTMRMAQIYKRLVLDDYYGSQQVADGRYNLQRLSVELNLPYFEAHDALEDALQTAYLFIFLVKKLSTVGITTIRELFAAGKELALTTRKPDAI